jgi:hypothetical protein
MIWKTIHAITGDYNPVILHAIPIIAHALSGWLLFLLLRRVTGSLWSLLPGLLFLLYPFSYQALEILGTLVHTLVTVEILAALLLWYDGRMLRSTLRLVAACVMAILALWTHEYGATIFPLLALMEGVFWWQGDINRPTRWLAVPFVAELLYLYLWWFGIDKNTHEHITTADKLNNSALWVQDFAYPITRYTYRFTSIFGGNPQHMVVVLGLASIMGVLVACWWGGQVRLALIALALGVVAFLPAVATLTYEYMQNGPRLFYVVAPASAIFWGLLPMLRFGHARIDRIWRVGTLLLIALTVVQSVRFIDVRMTMLERGSPMVAQIVDWGAQYDGGRALLMNAPSWFAPKTQEYPRGHLGIQLEPNYSGLDALVYVGSGKHVALESGSLAPNVNGWLYDFEPHGAFMGHPEINERLRAGVPVAVVDLYHDSMKVREVGAIHPAQPEPTDTAATFDNGLRIVGADIKREGDLLTIAITWYVERPNPGDYRVRTQIRSEGGDVLLERQMYPLSDMSPTRFWQQGDRIEDRLVLDISSMPDRPELANPAVWIALVSADDGSLLPVTGQSLETSNDFVRLGPVR